MDHGTFAMFDAHIVVTSVVDTNFKSNQISNLLKVLTYTFGRYSVDGYKEKKTEFSGLRIKGKLSSLKMRLVTDCVCLSVVVSF